MIRVDTMSDFCTIEDAFPASNTAMAGCGAGEQAVKLRREERKKMKRCKGLPMQPMDPFSSNGGGYSEQADPDRQALGPDPSPNPMRGSGATAPDCSNDDIVNAPRSAYLARRGPQKTNASKVVLRETEGPRTLIDSASKQPPSYFGADILDEEFTNYNPVSSDGEFMLEPNFTKTFNGSAEDRASGITLPTPSVVDAWKRLTPSGANTAFIEYLPPPGGDTPASNLMPSQKPMELDWISPQSDYVSGNNNSQKQIDKELKRRFDEIFSRLDDLETQITSGSENSQMEVFLFILSGMFVMFSVDIFARR